MDVLNVIISRTLVVLTGIFLPPCVACLDGRGSCLACGTTIPYRYPRLGVLLSDLCI